MTNKNPLLVCVGQYILDNSGAQPILSIVNSPFAEQEPVIDNPSMLQMMQSLIDNPVYDGEVKLPQINE